jgi:ribosomal protein L7Ae-like RNA K-turn-binding protein
MWLSASGDVLEFGGEEERAGDQKVVPESRGGRQGRQLVRAFAREARAPVVVPQDLGSLLQAALIQRTGELIGLARRAGQAVAGFEKAREHLRTTGARLVVQARDGSAAERARFLSGAPSGTEVIDPLTGEELGRVFGRDYVVHVAIAPGRLADRLAIEARRLAGVRTRSAGA